MMSSPSKLYPQSLTPAPIMTLRRTSDEPEQALSFAGYAIGIWGIVWPEPYDICICALIAACVLALILASLRPKTWAITHTEARRSVGGLWLLPSLALGMRGLWDVQLIDWQAPLLWGLCGAAILSFVLYVAQRNLRITALLVVFLTAFSATWGTLIFVNTRFDESVDHPFNVSVLDKSRAYKKLTSFELYVSRWGDRQDGKSVSVPQDLYTRVTQGDHICVMVHKGRLGFAWFDAEPCAE